MPPSIVETPEVWWPITAIGMEDDRDLSDLLVAYAGFDYHLAGELHTGSCQSQFRTGGFGEGSKTTMSVAYGALKEQIENTSQHGITYVAM